MKSQITREEYIQLHGLKLLGQDKLKELDKLVGAVAHIIGEDDDYNDWSTDFIWDHGRTDVDTFLKKRKIEVVDD